VVASNDLDEYEIARLEAVGARIGVWGVGTRLTTAYDQPALGGVYKLGAIKAANSDWEPRLKLSEQAIKVSNPGVQSIRRFELGGEYAGDIIYPAGGSPGDELVDIESPTRSRRLAPDATGVDLLVPVFEAGARVWKSPDLGALRASTLDSLARLPEGVTRIEEPERYPVGLSRELSDLKRDLIERESTA